MAQPDQLAAEAEHAEKLGFHALEFSDHILIPESINSSYPYPITGDHSGGPNQWDSWNEMLITLTFLAAKTKKIRVITSIMVLAYRNPLLAAKMLATMDVLSKGRLVVGVGAGWMREEFDSLRTPPFQERGFISDEYILMFKELWTSDKPTYQGKYFSFSGIKFLPKPVQTPHPPIWVGGESPGAMKRAASLGDAWYPMPWNPKYPLRNLDQLRQAIDRLTNLIEKAGRRPQEVQICYVAQLWRDVKKYSDELFVGDSDKIVSDIRACEKLGISYISFDLQGENPKTTMTNLDRFAREVLTKTT